MPRETPTKGKNYSMKHDSLKFHTTSDTMVLVERKKKLAEGYSGVASFVSNLSNYKI